MILKEINPEDSFEGLMLKLKLQYTGLIRRANSLEKSLMQERLKAGREGDDRGQDGWMASPTSMDMSLSELRKIVEDKEAWHAAAQGVTQSWSGLRD